MGKKREGKGIKEREREATGGWEIRKNIPAPPTMLPIKSCPQNPIPTVLSWVNLTDLHVVTMKVYPQSTGYFSPLKLNSPLCSFGPLPSLLHISGHSFLLYFLK